MITGAFHIAVKRGVTFTRLNARIHFTGGDLLSWWRLPAYYCTVHELCWQRHNSTSPSLLSLQIHRCVLSTCHCSVHKTTTFTKQNGLESRHIFRIQLKNWVYRISSNLIRTSFCRFLNRQKSQFAVPIRTFPSTAPCLQGRLIE